MDLLVMDVVEKYISEQLPMNTIERNNGDFSYRPVTEGDRGYEHPSEYLNQNRNCGAKSHHLKLYQIGLHFFAKN
jgi:hypothetical protein